MSKDCPKEFATLADFLAWRYDLVMYGTAILDSNGKHIPLREFYAR